MGIDLTKSLARVFASVFIVIGITGAVLAFVAPGSGR
jgi:hypothetical protein